MTDCVLRLAESFVKPREVVVAIGQARILADRGLVGFDGRLRAAEIFEEMSTSETFTEFLTLPLYEKLD